MSTYTSPFIRLHTIENPPEITSTRARMLTEQIRNLRDHADETEPSVSIDAQLHVLEDELAMMRDPHKHTFWTQSLRKLCADLVTLGVLNNGCATEKVPAWYYIPDITKDEIYQMRAAHGDSPEPTIPAFKLFDTMRWITVEEIEASLTRWDAVPIADRPEMKDVDPLIRVLSYGLDHRGCEARHF